jgi:hypothetical protein
MKITFIPDLPSEEAWDEVRGNIRNELSHLKGRFVEFPSELFVRMNTMPHRATGVAAGPDGTPIVEISYDLLDPHRAEYRYVGTSKPIQPLGEPDA